MNTLQKSFTFLLVLLMLTSTATQAAYMGTTPSTVVAHDPPSMIAATNLVVVNNTINYDQSFNDDDFEFYVYNGSLDVATANVTLYNVTDDTKYDSMFTVGDGSALFINVPQGIYEWNVTWSGVSKNGTMVSDGPEAFVDYQIGNLDTENNDDDLLATVVDIDGNPGEGLNFTIYSRDTNTIYTQTILGSDGVANISNIAVGNYTWLVTVQSLQYAGVVIAQENFTTDGTTMKVGLFQPTDFTGSDEYMDLEVFIYFETTLAPVVGALVNVTFYNGTEIEHKLTPTNGSVTFIDLPAEFVNMTASYGGTPIGAGPYFWNLTAVYADLRKPIISSPSDMAVLFDTANITLTWSVEDEYPGLLELFVDDELIDSEVWTNQTSYTFNATGYDIGVYEVKLVATDLNDNFNEDTVTLRLYENVTPIIEGPADLEFYYTETGQSLRWNLTDDFLDSFIVYQDNSEIDNGTLNPDVPFYTHSLVDLGIGVYTISLWINDTSGNSAMDNVTVTVAADDVAPVITYEPGTVIYARGDRDIVRNWTATDDFKSTYTITVDGIVVVDAAWTEETIEFDFWGLAEGAHLVVLTVTDLGGNTASSTVEVQVGMPTSVIGLIGVGALAGILILVGVIVWFIRYR